MRVITLSYVEVEEQKLKTLIKKTFHVWLLAFCHIPVFMSTYITKEVSLGPCIAPLIRFVKGLPLKSLCLAISPIRHPCTKGGQGTGMGIKAGCPLM